MNSIEERVDAPEANEAPVNEIEQTTPELTLAQEPTLSPAAAGQVTVELNEDGLVSLMEQLLNDPASAVRIFEHGQVVEGIVMYKERDTLLVDIGSKSEGIVPSRELQSVTPDEMQDMKVGDAVLVYVVMPENQEGQVVLSLDKARMEKGWRKLQQLHEAGETVEGEIFGLNKGGLLVRLENVQGFVPSSQVSGLSGAEAAKQEELSRMVNSKMRLKIIEIDRERNRLILSERQASQQQRDAHKDRLMSELAEGQVRDGVVTTICDFGAFVDIGGADGLVHLSELSWTRVGHPREVLKAGERVKVYVLNVDENRKKVALSIKRTLPEPWSQIAVTYHPGQLLEGTITQITNFGAFARIADGVEGLIHVSELAESRVQHPSSVVKEGDVVSVRLLSVDPQRRRMALSIKRAAPDYNNDNYNAEERELATTEA